MSFDANEFRQRELMELIAEVGKSLVAQMKLQLETDKAIHEMIKNIETRVQALERRPL